MNKIFAFIILLLVITVSVVIITSENANAIHNTYYFKFHFLFHNPFLTIIANAIFLASL